jgi:dipeptidyl aminopeptidase/acylaminoacyl peptidase
MHHWHHCTLFSLCLMSVLSASVNAESRSDRLSLMDVFNLQLPVDPQISPDGKRIVYVRQFCDIMTDQRHSNLWLVNADGSGNRALTTGNYDDSSPRWSPDGSQLIYLSTRDGTPQIYRRWMDTGETAKVTSVTTAPSGIAWSPDGKWISFAAHVPAEPPKIGALPKPPEGAKWAEPAKVIDKLIYRYNGLGYLKPGYAQLFVVPADGGTPRQITSGEFQHGGQAFGAGDAVWTPDGKYLIVQANRHPDRDEEPLNTEIYQFSVADGTVKALTDRKGPDADPAVSPDGKQIAYVGFDDQYQGYQVRKLYVMERDGTQPRLVTGDLDRDVRSPQFCPDGKAVYFLSDDQGTTGLYRATLDGQVQQLADHVGSTRSAYGGGASFSIAKDGTFATTVTRPNLPGDIAAGRQGQSGTKTITAVNEGLLSARKLGSVEEIWYESKKDGRKIEGWIIKPPDFDPNRKYPLVLEIHGGPFANYGDRFDLEKQLIAAGDYVVLYTNPRGSTSYGGEFGNLIHHAYPGDDFFDLNSGVDAMLAKGYVDPDQLFVSGGSGGGVLTCWVIGRTQRFRAAVTVYPVINWYSFVLSSDIGNWVSKYWFPGLPWDNVEHYERRSLLSVVKNVKTPTMVLTGENDYRTPMSESEQYYQALKLLGVESVLVRVPDEPHGISVRPSHHISKIHHVIAWFDQHRKPGRETQTATASNSPGLKP